MLTQTLCAADAPTECSRRLPKCVSYMATVWLSPWKRGMSLRPWTGLPKHGEMDTLWTKAAAKQWFPWLMGPSVWRGWPQYHTVSTS